MKFRARKSCIVITESESQLTIKILIMGQYKLALRMVFKLLTSNVICIYH